MLKRARYDSPLSCWIIDALHRKALPTSSLAIGEYGPIIALQDPLDKGKPDVVVDLLRGRVLCVYPIEGEALGGVIGEAGVDHGAGVGPGVHVDNFL